MVQGEKRGVKVRKVIRYLMIGLCIMCIGVVMLGNDDAYRKSQVQWPIKKFPDKFKEIATRVLSKSAIGEEQIISEKVEQYLNDMTIEEKIGQLFMIALDSEEGEGMTILNSQMKAKLQKSCVGGIILFKNNIKDKVQTKVLIETLQESSEIPLFIAVDEEGGMVSRVGNNSNINEKPFMAAGDIGKTGDEALAYAEASRMGKLLKEIGFNMDFAPCGDIYNNPANTVIGSRSFGTSSEMVTPMMLAFAKGLKAEGILPVIKHYPGHGNTMEDSHDGLAYVYKSLEELEMEELIPFKEGIRNGVSGMMKGHLLVSAIDDRWPVSLSQKWQDYIEKTMDINDVLMITDALNMGAIVNNYGEDEVVLRSFLAGNDILLMPTDIEEAEEVIYKAYQTGVITKEQINHAVRKILTKKVEQNILPIS